MGVSTQDLLYYRARPAALEPVEEWDCSGKVLWQAQRRSSADRGDFLALQFLKLCNFLGLPSTGWSHDQGIFSTEERAEAYVVAMKAMPGHENDKWDIYPKTVDVGFPLRRVRPKLLRTANSQPVPGYVVLPENELKRRDEIFEAMKARMEGLTGG